MTISANVGNIMSSLRTLIYINQTWRLNADFELRRICRYCGSHVGPDRWITVTAHSIQRISFFSGTKHNAKTPQLVAYRAFKRRRVNGDF